MDSEQKIFFVNQQKTNLHEHSENGVETWENEKPERDIACKPLFCKALQAFCLKLVFPSFVPKLGKSPSFAHFFKKLGKFPKTWEKVGKVKKDGKKKFMGIISWCIFSTSKIYFEDYFDIYGL